MDKKKILEKVLLKKLDVKQTIDFAYQQGKLEERRTQKKKEDGNVKKRNR